MKILLSEHAEDRMYELVRCKKEKMGKLAMKAWLSKEPVDERSIANAKLYVNKRNGNTFYKLLMGYIYVFTKINKSTTVLVTVMLPTTKLARDRSQPKKIR